MTQDCTDTSSARISRITAAATAFVVIVVAAVIPDLFTQATDYLGRVVFSADKYAQTFDQLSLLVSLGFTIVFVTLWSTSGRWAPSTGYVAIVGIAVRILTVGTGIGFILFLLFISVDTELQSVLVFLNQSDLLPGDLILTFTVLLVGELFSVAIDYHR